MHGRDPGVIVIDEDEQVVAVATKSNLLLPSPVKLILVDHNELSQAVSGADQVDIEEVIDHHRLGNFHTDLPIRFINQPLGSTCSVVAALFRQAGIVPQPQIAGLMMAGLLSDTVLLKSPTTTQSDRELLSWLAELSQLDPDEFGRKMFQAGSALGAYPDAMSLLTADLKEYEIDGRRLGVGQVEVVNLREFEERRSEIAASLEKLHRERRLDLAGLLVTDIVAQTSLLLAFGTAELIELIDYPRVDSHLYELKGVLSRKKQLMPQLLKAFKAF